MCHVIQLNSDSYMSFKLLSPNCCHVIFISIGVELDCCICSSRGNDEKVKINCVVVVLQIDALVHSLPRGVPLLVNSSSGRRRKAPSKTGCRSGDASAAGAC